MSNTSIEAYRSFTAAELQDKEIDVLNIFIERPKLAVTREILADMLGWKESAVCGRANSMVAKGVLEEIDGGKTRSGRSAKLLRLVVAGQGDLFC